MKKGLGIKSESVDVTSGYVLAADYESVLKQIMAKFHRVKKVITTGGVSPDEANLIGWFKAGVHCVGMGSQLFLKDVVESGNYQAITTKCFEALAIIKKLRT